MEILYVLLVLLVVTRLLGELCERWGQSALVGELVGGVVIGLVVRSFSGTFPILSGLTHDPVFEAITDLGVFFLMLHAGVELHPKELSEASSASVLVAVGGMVLPFCGGFALGWLVLPASDYRLAQALFLGTALAITAVPVAVKVLMDLGQLRSRAGRVIVSAAVIDDLLSLLLLAALTAVIRTGSLPGLAGLALIVAKAVLFLVVAAAFGRWAVPLLGGVTRRAHAGELEFSLLLINGLALAVLAELCGLHFLVGAFLAGLSFGRKTVSDVAYRDVKARVAGATTGFLAPVFFASIGLHLDLRAALEIPAFVVILTVVAFLGKLLGSGLMARLVGLSSRSALAVGTAMSARGAVELIVAGVALRAGLFSHPEPPPPVLEFMFSAVVIMALVTTLATPIVLRLLLPRRDT